MKEAGIGYGSVNHPVDRDPCCGYTGIIDLRRFGVVPPVHGAHQIAGDAADALKPHPLIVLVTAAAGALIVDDTRVAAAGVPVHRVVHRGAPRPE